MHRRIFVTVPVIAISDDKHHDTHFVQHFMVTHIYGPDGWLQKQSSSFQLSHNIWHWNSDGAASHFKQVGTLYFMHKLCTDYSLHRITWCFGCPGHGKGLWDGLGGVIKNTCKAYMLRHDITIASPKELHTIASELFASSDKKLEYLNRKNTQCKEWHIVYTDSAETKLLRESPEVQVPTKKLDAICGFKHQVGTQRIFFYEALGKATTIGTSEYRQLGLRINACNCNGCVTADSRNTAVIITKKTPRSHQPPLPTINPAIVDCQLKEGWDYQHVRLRSITTTNSNSSNNTAASSVPINDLLDWAQCELCLKWRTTSRPLGEDESFQCNNVEVIKHKQFAHCGAPVEDGAEEGENV